jgi:hypothetical protein
VSVLQVIALVLAAAGGLGGIGAVIVAPAQIRKAKGDEKLSAADAAATLNAATIAMLGPASQEISRLFLQLEEATNRANGLKLKLEHAERELGDLRAQVDLLSKDLEVSREENSRLRQRKV